MVYGCCGCANSSCTGASSTFRPAYMTTTRSAMSATTPRLCVMSTIAVPSRSRMSRIRSRIPAWIVTSSAVVGSSAIRIFGSHASAIAIITRCRIPPESWCGYSSSRRSGAGMRTRSSSSIARRRAARAREVEVPLAAPPPICRPTRERGVERRHRLLEDEGDLAPADAPQRTGRRGEQVDALEDRLARHDRGLGQQPEQRQHRHATCRSPTRRRCPAPRPARARRRTGRRPASRRRPSRSEPRGHARRAVRRSPCGSRIEDVSQSVAEQVERERAEEDREPGIDGEPRCQ